METGYKRLCVYITDNNKGTVNKQRLITYSEHKYPNIQNPVIGNESRRTIVLGCKQYNHRHHMPKENTIL